MKKTLLLFSLIALYSCAFSQNFHWAKAIGGATNDAGMATVVDNSGNAYITGYFSGKVDFDPDTGTCELSAAGNVNCFVSKFDASGKLIWAKSFAGNIYSVSRGITIDNEGNLLITGFFYGTADFDPGKNTYNLSSAGAEDIFILKLNKDGDLLWAKKIGGIKQDIGISIITGKNGKVYISGYFEETVDFDPGSGVKNFTADLIDIFILKLDSTGSFVWVKCIGGSGPDKGNGIVVDDFENVFVSGDYYSSVDFNPGTGVNTLTAKGNSDGYVLKLNSSGNYVWAKTMGGVQQDNISSIAIDKAKNIYITGSIKDTMDNEPANIDVIVSKFDSTGNLAWTKSFGNSYYTTGQDLSIDGYGDLYVLGTFNGTVDFDPGAGKYNLTASASNNAFILKLNKYGDFIWAKNFTGFGRSVSVDHLKNIYITGGFKGSGDFDPGSGTFNLNSNTSGYEDAFLLKLRPQMFLKFSGPLAVCKGSTAKYSVDAVENAIGYTWKVPSGASINSGQNTTSVDITFGNTSGIIKVTPVFSSGNGDPDSIQVSVKTPKADFKVNDACENDSIKFTNQSKEAVTYKWKFGDGQYSNIESPKHFYEISGISKTFNATLVATVIAGCSDSITKYVTINAGPNSNFTYTISGRLVSFNANQSTNTKYQWSFGDGKTSDIANPKHDYIDFPSGKYEACLTVTNAATCSTKTCKDIIITGGVNKFAMQPVVKVYPNPNKGDFQIILENPERGEIMFAFNSIGQIIETIPIDPLEKNYSINLNTANGIYFLKLTKGNSSYFVPIVINKF